jgi:integrase/recombinase XerD
MPASLLMDTGPTCAVAEPITWKQFWGLVLQRLNEAGYAEGSRQQYRYVLRGFYRFFRCVPEEVTPHMIRQYLWHLADHGASYSWVGMNIAVLRTSFDRVWERDVTRACLTPRRPHRLPDTLNPDQILDVINAAETVRDQLVLGLLYGCGLKPGEVSAMRWRHVDADNGVLRLPLSSVRKRARIDTPSSDAFADAPPREIPLPASLLPLLAWGKTRNEGSAFVLPGRHADTPLCTRMIERIVKKSATSAGVGRAVTAMTLRHSFAVHCLRKGWTVRELQHVLGHRSINATLIYKALIPPRTETPRAITVAREASTKTIHLPGLQVSNLGAQFAFLSTMPGVQPFSRLLAMRLRGGLFRSRAPATSRPRKQRCREIKLTRL